MTVDIIDLNARTEPGLRARLAIWYRDLACANRSLGLHDLAEQADERADGLEYGGVVTLGRDES